MTMMSEDQYRAMVMDLVEVLTRHAEATHLLPATPVIGALLDVLGGVIGATCARYPAQQEEIVAMVRAQVDRVLATVSTHVTPVRAPTH